ncbi:hypothetical protein [Streptomyces violascens]|uniref:hypothetical protein n=1 Tax=Streptomyces violascens TaxID=67381 RepID=UPI00368AF71E
MEWTDPKYTEMVTAYREQREALPLPKRRRGWHGRRYGSGLVVLRDPATGTVHSVNVTGRA